MNWIEMISNFQKTSNIPLSTLSEGPGIYYVVYAVANIVHVEYVQALIITAIALGSVYVVPCYWMYRRFGAIENSDFARIAMVGTVLVSMSDVMIYSTTVARPLLIGLFLLPIAIWALQSLYENFRWITFIGLLTVSGFILLTHAPFTYVVLMVVVSSTALLYDRLGKWSAGYILGIYTMYGIVIQFLIPDLGRIWRIELFSAYPLRMFAIAFGNEFLLIFPLLGLSVLLIVFVRSRVHVNLTYRLGSSRFQTLTLFLLALSFAVVVAVLGAYSAYIDYYYGSMLRFLILQGWKGVFGIIALMGLGIHLRRTRNSSVVVAWVISLAVLVVILALYTPLRGFPGLFNLDERVAEFLYYPGFYFVAVGLDHIAKNSPPRVFRWVILPLISLFTIPSMMTGVRDVSLIRPINS